MLGSVSLAFSALTQLFVPEGINTTRAGLQFVVGLAIGLPATAVFYYFQHLDSTHRHNKRESELEILNRYMESEEQERVFKRSTATPVFNSRSGTERLKVDAKQLEHKE